MRAILKIILCLGTWLLGTMFAIEMLKCVFAYTGGMGTALCLVFVKILIYWFPKKNLLGLNTDICEKRQVSNPLYKKGYFRKQKSEKYLFMSELKGIYRCQIFAIFQIIFLVGYGFYSLLNGKRHYWTVEVLLGISVVIDMMIVLCVDSYYLKIWKKSFLGSLKRKREWEPFKYVGDELLAADTLFCPYRNFEELKMKLQSACELRGLELYVKQVINDKGIVWKYVRQREEIFLFQVIRVREFTNECIELLDDNFKLFCEEFLEEKDTKAIYFTFLICTEHETTEFRRLFRREVCQGNGCYRLPAGICFETQCLYIAGQRNKSGLREYDRMRKELLEMLNVSVDRREKED